MIVYKVRSTNPDAEAIRAAAEAIRTGRLVIFPTETVYGLACDAFNESAVSALIQAKGRRPGHPLPLQVADVGGLEAVASRVPKVARLLANRFWPGPLTLILPKNERVSDVVSGGRDSVGVRIPDHAIALALLNELASPVVATSANMTGQDPPLTACEAASEVGGAAAVVLDAGQCRLGRSSTVVDTSVTPPRILRLGSIGWDEVSAAIEEAGIE